ncbi:CBN-HEN-1 protein [Caenorhabditis brenneri]|uniref:CBN-HEN-1 protein n=1 Tax=Caenorhabditis brenneri TaxID=135651 RepID=G0N541_CAEBE|nr:CBN-HEN-1 protein [Caenorhabditis brenneri]
MNFHIVIFALCSTLAIVNAAFGRGSRPLNNADEVTAIKPVCETDRHGNKYIPCATPDQNDSRNWPCIKHSDLCNSRRDCPNGDDEDHFQCFYHKFRIEEVQALRKILDEVRGK